MKGDDVKAAQRLLKENGVWVGKVDGVFGEITARACSQAKYVLGYRSPKITPVYDATLAKFLSGRSKPNLIMQQRAKSRKNKVTPRSKVIDIAREYLGIAESPKGSNKVLFSDWYGIQGPWCAMFVTYCYVQAGSKAFKKSERWAYCPFILADAKAQRNGLTVVPGIENVQQGDVVLYDWDDDGIADHVGMVETVGKSGKFYAIEGNTSGTNPSDGGMVARMERSSSDVIAFIRVVN
jgi:hypothetical protein